MKTIEELEASIESDDLPPAGLSPEKKALWLTKKNRWEDAHDIAQDINTETGSWIHAMLHRVEGDLGNAAYWYSRAGKPAISDTEGIEKEWREITTFVLGES
jgi:hypothetical protein